jgi:hypothetical protein
MRSMRRCGEGTDSEEHQSACRELSVPARVRDDPLLKGEFVDLWASRVLWHLNTSGYRYWKNKY